MTQRIQLLSQQGTHPAGSVHQVVSIIPHGGNYDCEQQFVLEDGTHVPSDRAECVMTDVTKEGDIR